MDLTRSCLLSLFLCISVLNEIPRVTCQDEEGSQCLPKKAFLALLRLPEISSNLAAYSRTSRIIQDARNHNDFAHLKASAEENDDTEICIPGALYLELFRDPSIRGHLTSIGRTQRVPEYPASRSLDDSEEIDSKDAVPDAEKRSIATLAKNDDLPISIQDREENQDDDEKRNDMTRFDSPSSESLDALVRALAEEDSRRSLPSILQGYTLPSGEPNMDSLVRDYPVGKRNIGSLARDYALPLGRRNLASLARDSELPSGKRNIGSLAREQMLPYTAGKRNVASLARVYMLPQGKRNIAALARDYALPNGKRYLDAVARNGGSPFGMDYEEENKRNIASVARNAGRSRFTRRSPGLSSGGYVLRTFSQARRPGGFSGSSSDSQTKNRPGQRANMQERRTKRQIDFSDEYPLPAVQSANALDYEEMLEALTGQYPNAEKRFMGASNAYSNLTLAKSASRLKQRKIRIADRENPADGPSTDYSTDASAWPLKSNFGSKPRYLQALHGDCRHGFKRFLLLPAADNFLPQKLHMSAKPV